jgi:hypothetical protein
MSKTHKRNESKKHRNLEVVQMMQQCHGGPMRDRRMRRAKDARRSWQREQEDC